MKELCELRIRINNLERNVWILRNPPRFKYGDQVSYNKQFSSGGGRTIDRVTILSVKEVKSPQESKYYIPITRIYYASYGGLDDIGKMILEVEEDYCELFNK